MSNFKVKGNLEVQGGGTVSGFDIVTTLLFNKSRGGYYKLNNGMIIQWGYLAAYTADGKTINFNIPFSDTNYTVLANNMNTAATDFYALQVQNLSTTQFRVFTTYTSSRKAVTWIAIGY